MKDFAKKDKYIIKNFKAILTWVKETTLTRALLKKKKKKHLSRKI